MKKIIYIASFLCAALLAGCDDFLTTESPLFRTGIVLGVKLPVK